ncbi:MAG: mechanosensitive ion channel domain-containing protein [Alphaproteobacteria bacterium]
MDSSIHSLKFLRDLVWQDFLLVLCIIVVSRVLIIFARWVIWLAAEQAHADTRLAILRWAPLVRLSIEIATIVIITPILIEPNFQDTVALVATLGLALAFAFKDYGSCLVAGFVTILENPYQPGDWIEMDGAYGEVKSIGMRAVHIMTADDTEVIIPHSRIWSTSVHNASSGQRSLLCVTLFHLHPDHDAGLVRQRLQEVAQTSSYIKPETKVTVIAMEKPWGTLYRVKAYVKESREQFLMITDLTVRGKEALRAMGLRFAQVPFAETK